jgi:dTMP kinase
LITFEGTEASGKSTQINHLADRLRGQGRSVRVLREPGGTKLGEEIRHTLKHSASGAGMTAEAELLLMNAARAQLVREVIRPALANAEVVLCDRYFDSTLAYQGWGRQLDLEWVRQVIEFVVGPTIPDLTLMLRVPHAMSLSRRAGRAKESGAPADRFEDADDAFFSRVVEGYEALARAESGRIRVIDATRPIPEVHEQVWRWVEPLVSRGEGFEP